MEETRARFKIYGPNGSFEELEAMIDTGATFSKIPQSLVQRLGLEVKYETEVELGDGRVIKRELVPGEVEIGGVKRPVLIAVGGEEEKIIIGYTTLEILGFKVDPITGRLERTRAIEYQAGYSTTEG